MSAVLVPAEPTGVLGATPAPCLLHAAVGEVRPGVQVAMLCVECVRLRPPAAQGDPRATAPAELREAAGRAAHRAYCETNPLRCHSPSVHGGSHAGCICCDPLLAAWPDLTEPQREAFRASQDAGLSVVAPVLVEAQKVALRAKERLDGLARERGAAALFPTGLCADLLARLAALGIKP